MKELECPYSTCPHCNKEISIESLTCKVIDVKKVEGEPYGIQARWKELYTCPYCGEQFYVICEH